jgi:hypothetical protein
MRTDTDGGLLHFSFVCRKFEADFEVPGKSGGLNGSTQHLLEVH